jgi:hypothetical protein
MSAISTTHHKVVPLTKDTKPFINNVLLRIIGKKNSELKESFAVSAPIITDADIMSAVPALLPVIRNIVQDARQQLARSLILGGATVITTESISIHAATLYLTDESSGRLTTQVMQEWFAENYSIPAIEYVCEAVKFDVAALSEEQEKAVIQRTNVIRDAFAGFASPKYTPSIKVCNGLIKFCDFVSEQMDDRMLKLSEKIRTMRDKQIAEMNDALFDINIPTAAQSTVQTAPF